jgi:hypothetical protein
MFKKNQCIGIGLAALCLQGFAEDFQSGVINNYNQATISFGYTPNLLSGVSDAAYGIGTGVSFDFNNTVLGVNAGYSYWDIKDIGSANIYSIGTSLGYVFRLNGNRLNVTPTLAFNADIIDDGSGVYYYSRYQTVFYPEYYATMSLSPGVKASYAVHNRIGLNASYFYDINVYNDTPFNAPGFHSITFGPTFAVTEKIGWFVRANFSFAAEGQSSELFDSYSTGFSFNW